MIFFKKLWMFEKTDEISILDIIKNMWPHLMHKCQNRVILRDIPIKYFDLKQRRKHLPVRINGPLLKYKGALNSKNWVLWPDKKHKMRHIVINQKFGKILVPYHISLFFRTKIKIQKGVDVFLWKTSSLFRKTYWTH